MSINPDLIEAIAAELVVDASLVEKDWYALRIIEVIAKVKDPIMQLVFSGGTSLAKGFGLIQRFSEDIDFKVAMSTEGLSRSAFRTFRERIIEAIRAGSEDWSLSDQDIQSLNGSRFFKCEIAYRHLFERTAALRPHVKLEVSFDSPALAFEERPLQSFVSKALRQKPEVALMPCVAPVETAADKLSALTWRVPARERDSPQDDAALIRHLHDLAMLEGVIVQSSQFVPLVLACLTKDARRDKHSEMVERPAIERLRQMLNILKNDPLYTAEYERFVLGMSYAAESERSSFQDALEVTSRLVALFQ